MLIDKNIREKIQRLNLISQRTTNFPILNFYEHIFASDVNQYLCLVGKVLKIMNYDFDGDLILSENKSTNLTLIS